MQAFLCLCFPTHNTAVEYNMHNLKKFRFKPKQWFMMIVFFQILTFVCCFVRFLSFLSSYVWNLLNVANITSPLLKRSRIGSNAKYSWILSIRALSPIQRALCSLTHHHFNPSSSLFPSLSFHLAFSLRNWLGLGLEVNSKREGSELSIQFQSLL